MVQGRAKGKWEQRRKHQATFDVAAALQAIQDERKPVDCWVGKCPRVTAKPAHTPCCSSHDKPLCCEHYKQLHFVETGPTPCHAE